MKIIPLSKGKEAIVDDEDYAWISEKNWHANPVGRNKEYFYAYRNAYHRSPMAMHRDIMGDPKGMIVDHINGNTLDNRRANLRLCTKSENKRNSYKCIRATRGKLFKGVYQDKRYPNTYFAAVYVDGKKITKRGNYRTPEEAARAYDRLATLHYGEFANLNFPLSRSKGDN